ncbi:putative ATP-grasp-modified RiPP [Sphaerisporangium rhizosphaerae]|uniref:ATP-grasp-modified RiPP n=1 Tax=Sphaerisporangium rhizosphaerae TaxID=2269375 RepID=A0ABW2PE46_9ACTN
MLHSDLGERDDSSGAGSCLSALDAAQPWGLTRMSPLPPASSFSYSTVRLDPVSQQAVHVGPGGEPIKAGARLKWSVSRECKHGSGSVGSSQLCHVHM